MTHNFWQLLKRPFSVLAPMEDVTDTTFRCIVAHFHRPDVFFTEFTSADGLFSRGHDKLVHRLRFHPTEQPIVAQIWGNNPDNYVKAAKLLREYGFAGIDINMGCPVNKVVKRGQCAGLIENPTLARELFIAAKEGAGELPVSIKTRLGFRKWCTNEWVGFLLELKPAAITIHGRIAKELSEKPANWDEIAKAVKLRNALGSDCIIIGNGDVSSYNEIIARAHESRVDGVMVGRGIFNNLCIFDPSNRSFKESTKTERINALLRHIELFELTWGTERPYKIFRKFFRIYISDFPGATTLREKLVNTETSLEAFNILKDESNHHYRCLDNQ